MNNSLLSVVPEKLQHGLTIAETLVLDAATAGTYAKFPGHEESKTAIRAELLYWLCVSREAANMLHVKGVCISGATIQGNLDFETATLQYPLRLHQCSISDGAVFDRAVARVLDLSGSTIASFSAPGLLVEGDLSLASAHLKGAVDLNRAAIRGGLDCRSATLCGDGDVALYADLVDVKGGVSFQNAQVTGELRLAGGTLHGGLDCSEATLTNDNGVAFNASELKVTTYVLFRKAHVTGSVHLVGGRIDHLDCSEAIFTADGGEALVADGLSVNGNTFFRKAQFTGAFRLPASTLNGEFSCSGASFRNGNGDAIMVQGMTVNGNAFFRNTRVMGQANLIGMNIKLDFDCDGAVCSDQDGSALNAERILVKGNVHLRNAEVTGEIDFKGAELEGNLECQGGRFFNEAGNAFQLDSASIWGSVFFHNCQVGGHVVLTSARIGRNIECVEVTFMGKSPAWILQSCSVDGILLFDRFPGSECSLVHLAYARVGVLMDTKQSWPDPGRLWLVGFEYNSLGPHAPKSAGDRLYWLHLQVKDPFHLQPYEQLVKVLREMGQEKDVRQVLIAKQRALRKYGSLSPILWCVSWLSDKCIGYGYRSWRVLFPIAFFICVGWWVFDYADRYEVMRPSKERMMIALEEGKNLPRDYPRLEPVMYSIDVFVPFLDLHQEDYWLPTVRSRCDSVYLGWTLGQWIRIYMWLHIALGWILSTLAALAMTGLVRRE